MRVTNAIQRNTYNNGTVIMNDNMLKSFKTLLVNRKKFRAKELAEGNDVSVMDRLIASTERRIAELENEIEESKKPLNYANLHGYTDIYPHEVVKVISDKTIEIRALDAKLDESWKPEIEKGGFSGHCVNNHSQRWHYTSNTKNPIFRIRASKKFCTSKVVAGEKVEVQGYADAEGQKYFLATSPRRFYDYNF